MSGLRLTLGQEQFLAAVRDGRSLQAHRTIIVEPLVDLRLIRVRGGLRMTDAINSNALDFEPVGDA